MTRKNISRGGTDPLLQAIEEMERSEIGEDEVPPPPDPNRIRPLLYFVNTELGSDDDVLLLMHITVRSVYRLKGAEEELDSSDEMQRFIINRRLFTPFVEEVEKNGEEVRGRLEKLRAALRGLVFRLAEGLPPAAEDLAVVNEVLETTPNSRLEYRPEGKLFLLADPPDKRPSDRLLGALAAMTAEYLTSFRPRSPLLACRECSRIFLTQDPRDQLCGPECQERVVKKLENLVKEKD